MTVAGLAACGDDKTETPVDAKPTPTPDAARVFKGFDADEGGEVRIEYVGRGDGNASARVTAVFYDNPGTTRFYPFLNLNGCTDTSLKMNWPTAEPPAGERTYLDPGKVIVSGGQMTLDVPRKTVAGKDVVGRAVPANAWFQHFLGGTGMDGNIYAPEKTKLDVTITGSTNMPAQIFDDVAFIPAAWNPISPPLSLTPFPIPADTAQTFTWPVVASGEPPGYMVNSLVAFTGANGPAVICVEPNDGSITVPANFINIARAKYPTGGTLARQTLTHVVRELVDKNGPTGKRIDFIGIWCWATPFMVP